MKILNKNGGIAASVIVSLLAFIICVGLIVGGTFAILSKDEILDNNVVTTGEIDLEVFVTNQSDTYVNASGATATSTNTTERSFSSTPSPTLVSLTNAAPGDYGTRTIRVDNVGDYAFSLSISILMSNESSEVLAEQIVITIKSADGNTVYKTDTLSAIKHSAANDTPYVVANSVAAASDFSFVITYEFLSSSGNAVQNSSVGFDIQLFATQIPVE